MESSTIKVFEYSSIRYSENGLFKKHHYSALSKYITQNEGCGFYNLIDHGVRFQNYVGVIKVGNLTIEVLPKCDRNQTEDKDTWQRVLLDMLKISLQVEAKTTTHADIHIRHHSVLETYLHLFMVEVQKLIHHGLVKKYRSSENNETALKGKLLIHKHISKNMVHAERFYVSHQIYDRNNRFNALLYQTLKCIQSMSVSVSTTRRCQSLLLDFPACTNVPVSEKTFHRLTYDRKTQAYHTALDLARIILLNYHPDVAGGHNNILSIMFDMNMLWENYIYYSLRKAAQNPPFKEKELVVLPQRSIKFWENNTAKTSAYLKPDIVIKKTLNDLESIAIIDTKWKYESKLSEQDLRQIYTYNHYFNATQGFLVYPGSSSKTVNDEGEYVSLNKIDNGNQYNCNLLYIDILSESTTGNKALNKDIGKQILLNLGCK